MKIPFQRIKDSANTLTFIRDKEISSSNSKLKPFYSVIKSLTELCEDQGEVIEQSPFWSRATIVGLMSSALFALGWLSIAKTDEIVTVTGKLEPLGSVQDIQMPLGGIASEILVKDGEEVSSGQIVMKLDAETTQQRLISLEESHKLKALQLDLKETELEKYLLLNMAEINMLKRNLDLQEEILSRFEFLIREGAASELQYLQQLNNVAEIKGKLDQVKIDRLRQEAAQKQQIQQLKADIKDLDSRITEASVNLRYQALKAPVDGIVFDLQPRGKGYVAQSTETVMKIVPYDKLHARVEIPSNQIGFVKIGMDTDLSIDSFPASDFGVLEGTVESIGSDALPPDQLDNRPDYRFPAIISLSAQQLELNSGQTLPLQVGMSITSNIKLRKVSYLQLLLGTFQDKVDSLKEI
jgi:HlyD family secretion protein